MLLLLLACDTSPKLEDTGQEPPACTFLDPGDRLRLEEGCADDVCVGRSYADVVDAAGRADLCSYVGSERVACAWGDLAIDFPDCNANGVSGDEEDCDLVSQTLRVSHTWDGTTSEGLGLGVEARCWEERLGPTPWAFGSNPSITVTTSPTSGPVTLITITWSRDE